jgi:hypothetical protein
MVTFHENKKLVWSERPELFDHEVTTRMPAEVPRLIDDSDFVYRGRAIGAFFICRLAHLHRTPLLRCHFSSRSQCGKDCSLRLIRVF